MDLPENIGKPACFLTVYLVKYSAMDERLKRGIREFNEGRFFEAHDILEDLWQGYREPNRVFLQALIQTAVGFYHLENKNLKGARSQLSKAYAKFGPYLPEYWGIAVGSLHSSLGECLRVLESNHEAPERGAEILKRIRIQFSTGRNTSISNLEENSEWRP